MKHTTASNLTRRQFLQRTAWGTASAAVGLGLAGCATPHAGRKIPVGVQLYSLREECKTDLPGMLSAVSKIGFKGVEFAGYWGRTAKQLRQMLDDNGLVACGTHTPYETVLPDQIQATIEFNQIIGNKFIIVPYMTGKTRQEWLDKAKLFNDLADRLKPLGLWTGYHAHSHDFEKIEGQSAWDIFFGSTKPEVIMQLDTSNCRDGGADPVEVLHRYPGRCRTIHIKPNGAGAEAVIGEDLVNWPGVFSWCETQGGTRWYVVEHESSKQPLATIQRTFDALRRMGKV